MTENPSVVREESVRKVRATHPRRLSIVYFANAIEQVNAGDMAFNMCIESPSS